MLKKSSGRKSLQNILYQHYKLFALIPIFLIELVLLVLYFTTNHYIAKINVKQLEKESYTYSSNLLKRESDRISQILSEVSRTAVLMQNNHGYIFSNSDNYKISENIKFDYAENGVFYKTTEAGSSLYYSASTPIGEKELKKALFTEAMDPLLKSIVDSNPNIVAAYFNSYDNMNRLYPFIKKVYEQYPPSIVMKDYNFYYLADSQYNPLKKPVWTDAYLDPAGNGWMMSCIVPVYKGETLEGVSGLDVTVDSFVKNILDIKLPYGAKMFMVDAKGTILAMPESIEILLDLKELKEHTYSEAITETVKKPEEYNLFKNENIFAKYLKKVFNENTDHIEFYVNNHDYVVIREIVEETGWYLTILIDKAEIFSYVNSYKSRSNKIGFIAIGLMSLFYIVFFYAFFKKSIKVAKGITAPVEELTESTSLIGTKDFTLKTINTEVQEIYQLYENFSTMANELQIHRNSLEDLVDKRTMQLMETNRQLAESESKYIDLFKESEATNKKLKQAQLTIIQQEKMASIGHLAAGIAHEINNPIGFISSNFSVFKQYIESINAYFEALKDAFDNIDKNTNMLSGEQISRLNILREDLDIDYILQDLDSLFDESDEGFKRVISIINNLRSFSRIDIDENLHDYDVNEGLRSTLAVARNEIRYVADVVTDFEDHLHIKAIGGELNQVFLNVLVNAAQAIECRKKETKGLIKVKTERSGDFVVCTIEDDGSGIPKENLSKIFDPFFTTKEPGKGTGLGLNISYDIIVNKHNGKIEVESSEDGTKFIISLPANNDSKK